jgi:hypothetical protein
MLPVFAGTLNYRAEGNPDSGPLLAECECLGHFETGGEYAYDCVSGVVQIHTSAEYVRVTAEPAFPNGLTNQGDMVSPLLGFLGKEGSSKYGPDIKQAENVW